MGSKSQSYQIVHSSLFQMKCIIFPLFLIAITLSEFVYEYSSLKDDEGLVD